MTTEKITMEGVKFHAEMQEVVPVIKMSTLLNIAEALECQSNVEVVAKIDACYGPSIQKDKDGKDVEVSILVNEVLYFKLAAEIIYQATVTACELKGREPDFKKATIFSVLTHQTVFSIILWFYQQVTLLSQAETQAEGNAPATIRITC